MGCTNFDKNLKKCNDCEFKSATYNSLVTPDCFGYTYIVYNRKTDDFEEISNGQP